jgi:thymidine phosphorylase
MRTQEFIRNKRNHGTHTAGDIDEFVAGVTSGDVADAQIAAWTMAVFLNGLGIDECVALTHAMATSGLLLRWGLDGPVIDKHSTGGVGDTVSLMLAPMVAACGGYVPMISGRGLGHTGGTYDKLESIPGYRATPTIDEFRDVVKKAGCSIIGQTADLAPADKRIYAIRDVTATVESIPLITASILSKKLAEGLDALVMDVKVGRGAFMEREQDAAELAESISRVATGAGTRTVALLTDMDQPLGSAAGNALEIAYAIDYLTGARREPRMHDVVMALGCEMLMVGKLAATIADARTMLWNCLTDGSAAERFARMTALMGGPADILTAPWSSLLKAPIVVDVPSDRAGLVGQIDTRAIGLIVGRLGGGRTRPQDTIDHSVGVTSLLAVGKMVDRLQPLATVHARTSEMADRACAEIRSAYTLADEPQPARPTILRRVTA